jgi:hypothetical protein
MLTPENVGRKTMAGGLKGKSIVSMQNIFGVLVCVLLVGLAAEVTVADANLVGWWKFDEGNGITAYDSAGNNDGTVYGAQWTSGQVGGALSFDGDDDYVEIADSANLDITEGITIGMWIKPYPGMDCDERGNWRYLLRKGEWGWGAYNLIYEASWPEPVIGFTVTVGSTVYRLWTNRAGHPDEFTYLAFTYDTETGEQKTYFNGNLDSQQITGGGIISTNNGPLRIGGGVNTGCPDGAGFFNGLIDEVAIFDRSLSAAEIQHVYQDELLGGRAFNPRPADGASTVEPNVMLSWVPGTYATLHDVYFGTDYNDVKDATTGSAEYMGNQDANSYYPGPLELGRTYYWRIDEVNEANLESPWKGDVWSFTKVDEILVGAYYYPWYGPTAHPTSESLRRYLVPRQHPALGNYDSASPSVITSHINQSHRGNIRFWVVSWWGPGTYEDQVFKNRILTHERAGELKYAIFYESTGRLGSSGNPDYSNLVPDFRYIAANYFDNPNYLRIDGRPVVFIYVTRAYFRGQGDSALAALRQAFPELYIVGDDVFGGSYSANDARKWDAVTAYDVYGQSLGIYGSTQSALDRLKDIYDHSKTVANGVGVGFIPAATPGFNDKAVRPGHDAAPRYFEDDLESVEGDLFREMLRDVVVPRVDSSSANMLMITSFNEWHEDTQIEPTRRTVGTTNVDNSGSGSYYTQGYYYRDDGYLYLGILFQETAGRASLQAAVDVADDGDTVIVPPATHRENISFDGANIVLRSSEPNNWDVVRRTIIKGDGSRSAVAFSGGEDANCVLAGLTITGAGNGEGEAGVLCLGEDVRPTIRNCMITRNGGTGIYCGDAALPSSPTISNCIIAGNGGAGIKAFGRASATIANCTIVENGAEGVDRYRGNPTTTNCAIWGNNGDAIYGGSKDVTYCDIEGGLEGEGNMAAEPEFVEAGYWDVNGTPNDVNDDFWVEGDYHLRRDSPCIDAGDPNYIPEANETDLDGKPRVLDGDEDGTAIVDMGAYEFEFLPAIEAVVKIRPRTLNLQSKGRWIMCVIRLPEDYNVADIDPNSILLEDEIPADRVWLQDEFAVVKFSRSALQKLLTDLETPAEVELLVSGELSDGTIFEGTDTIRVIDKGKRRNILPGRAGRKVILNRKKTEGL